MARTLVTNTGVTRFIGYLPPHGIELAHGASVTLDGDLRSILASGRGRYSRKTELNALDIDFANGDISLIDQEESSSSL